MRKSEQVFCYEFSVISKDDNEQLEIAKKLTFFFI